MNDYLNHEVCITKKDVIESALYDINKIAAVLYKMKFDDYYDVLDKLIELKMTNYTRENSGRGFRAKFGRISMDIMQFGGEAVIYPGSVKIISKPQDRVTVLMEDVDITEIQKQYENM